MLLHAQPSCGFFLVLLQEVCTSSIIVPSLRAASTGESAVNGEWAVLMQNVPSIRAVPYLMEHKRGALSKKEPPNRTPMVLMTG